MRAATALTLVFLGMTVTSRPASASDEVAPRTYAQYVPHSSSPRYYSAPPAPAPSYGVPAGDLRHGGVAILYLGANVPVGANAEDYSPGLDVGAILGAHVNPNLSLNAELNLNMLNSDYSASYESEYIGAITFSPLYHLGQGNLELAVGPKLGFFSYHLGYDDGYETYDYTSSYGFAYGFNAAVFVQLWPAMSLGGILSYTGHHATKWCTTDVYGDEYCDAADADDLGLITISAALRW